jgi:catechol 2,3-dioxygenase-like lactoylglutathione lyase family enzyme
MIWYRVRDLDAARAFYTGKLGFTEIDFNSTDGWLTLAKGKSTLGLAQGDPERDQPVAMVDVGDVKDEAERLRGEQVEVGTVLELHGTMRIVDVFDPDGNRLQLGQEIG